MRIIFHPSFGDSQACRWWDTPRVWFVTHQNLIPYSLCSGERFLVGWLLKKELEGGRRYHPRRPRGGQSGREKRKRARRKFSSTGGKGLGYRHSPDHFQTVKPMLSPDWAQKMLWIIVPNRRTVSPEFFSWVRTRRLFSRHICPVRLPSFPNQKRRNYQWVEKRFGCYHQEQFNLHWENSVPDGSQRIVKKQRWWESKKRNSLTRKNNNFARASRFFVHFLAVTAPLPRENA